MKKRILTTLAAAIAQGAFAADITVSAAASLTDAFGDIAKAYQAKYSDAKIDLNFAGSGALLQQISKGAPVDVFASADTVTMDKAADYIDPATRQNFVENRLVVIMPKDAKWDGKDLAALLDDKALKRIAIAHVETSPLAATPKARWKKPACGTNSASATCRHKTCASRWTTLPVAKRMPDLSMRPTPPSCRTK